MSKINIINLYDETEELFTSICKNHSSNVEQRSRFHQMFCDLHTVMIYNCTSASSGLPDTPNIAVSKFLFHRKICS